jgi:hypothetical protein
VGGCVAYPDGGDGYYSSEVYTSPAPAYYAGGSSYYSNGGGYYSPPARYYAPPARYYQPTPRYYSQPRIYQPARVTTSRHGPTTGRIRIAAGTAVTAAIGTMTTVGGRNHNHDDRGDHNGRGNHDGRGDHR